MSNGDGGAPLLEVRNLSKRFGAVQALSDFSMVVHAGEVVTKSVGAFPFSPERGMAPRFPMLSHASSHQPLDP